jgi:hypothetical protein
MQDMEVMVGAMSPRRKWTKEASYWIAFEETGNGPVVVGGRSWLGAGRDWGPVVVGGRSWLGAGVAGIFREAADIPSRL